MTLMEKVVNEKTRKKVKNFAKRSCQTVIPILGTVLASVSVKDLLDMMRYSGDVDYGDAVNAIMSSSMYSHDKTRAVSMLKDVSKRWTGRNVGLLFFAKKSRSIMRERVSLRVKTLNYFREIGSNPIRFLFFFYISQNPTKDVF